MQAEPMTYDKFLDEVDKRMDHSTGQSVVDAARWFAACTIASQILADYRVKDLASDIIDGGNIGASMESEEQLRDWFTEASESGVTGEEIVKWLDGHFG